MTEQIIEYVEKSVFSRFAEHLKHSNELGKLKSQIRRERNELKTLTDRELADIGITRDDALKEANRGYDDIPAHRVRNWFLYL
ncbi:MAG: DUF1127 domain-containing protein [Pseudomonadota bacterium]